MVSSEERLRILTMIQEGKITPEEGVQLLEALTEAPKKSAAEPVVAAPLGSRGQPRWLRVMVTETASGKVRANVRLPVNLVGAGMKMGARLTPSVDTMDMDQISQLIKSGQTGKVIEVYDDQAGEHVEIYLE